MAKLDFDNTEIAFAGKSDNELRWDNILFSLMNYPTLVNIGGRLAIWAFQLNLPIGFLVKSTIYSHFCGGETIEECKRVIHKLGESGIKTILDYGTEAKESEEDFDRTANHLIETLQFAIEDDDIHIISSKLSGLFKYELLLKVNDKIKLTPEEETEWERGKKRVEMISKAAHKSGIYLHIDAEESWIQDAIDGIAWEMSKKFNKEKPTVINAIQLYRKNRLTFLKKSLDHAKKNGYLCAVKLVRGAYMEKERERAESKGYPSPIHETLDDTHHAYNEGIKFCLEKLGDIYLSVATHNEYSCLYLARMMKEKGLPSNHPLVAITQLYGMGDHISFNMAKAGFNVEKYLPYGPVKEVIPYLIRRTRENTSVGGQMSRELNLIKKEIKRRMFQNKDQNK